MLAPSKATSLQAHLPVPVDDTAADALAIMFRDLAAINDNAADIDDNADTDGNADTHDNHKSRASDISKQQHAIVNTALEALKKTDLSHLLSTNRTKHTDAMPTTLPETIASTPEPLLSIQPQTDIEALLLAALQESRAESDALRSRNIVLRAANTLNQIYCGNTRSQLQAQDEKKTKKSKGKLTGKARLLSGDDFYEEWQEFEREKRTEERQKSDRQAAMVQYRAAKATWDQEEVKRKETKEKETEKHKKALAGWENAKKKAAAAATCRGLSRPPPFRVAKPKMPALTKGNPKPLVKDFTEAAESSSSASEGGSGDEGGEDSGEDEDEDEDNV